MQLLTQARNCDSKIIKIFNFSCFTQAGSGFGIVTAFIISGERSDELSSRRPIAPSAVKLEWRKSIKN